MFGGLKDSSARHLIVHKGTKNSATNRLSSKNAYYCKKIYRGENDENRCNAGVQNGLEGEATATTKSTPCTEWVSPASGPSSPEPSPEMPSVHGSKDIVDIHPSHPSHTAKRLGTHAPILILTPVVPCPAWWVRQHRVGLDHKLEFLLVSTLHARKI